LHDWVDVSTPATSVDIPRVSFLPGVGVEEAAHWVEAVTGPGRLARHPGSAAPRFPGMIGP
jgi:hypothetical protein